MEWTAVSAVSTLIGTAVVCWYTWETHKLRSLTYEQVKILKAGAQPRFFMESIERGDVNGLFSLTVYNFGGQARNIKVTSGALDVLISHPFLERGSHQHWKVMQKNNPNSLNLSEFDILVEYEDQFGEINRVSLKSEDIQNNQL